MILVCRVIANDHVIKGRCDFVSKNPSTLVTILLSLVAKGTVVVKI